MYSNNSAPGLIEHANAPNQIPIEFNAILSEHTKTGQGFFSGILQTGRRDRLTFRFSFIFFAIIMRAC